MAYKILHYLYFDGTSYWVGDESDNDDYEIIEKSYNLDYLQTKADMFNEQSNNSY